MESSHGSVSSGGVQGLIDVESSHESVGSCGVWGGLGQGLSVMPPSDDHA